MMVKSNHGKAGRQRKWFLEDESAGGLTQHDEVDLAPVVFATCFDLAVVFSRVRQLQIADQEGGVSVQVVACEGQPAGRVVVDVDLVVEKCDDLNYNTERDYSKNGQTNIIQGAVTFFEISLLQFLFRFGMT